MAVRRRGSHILYTIGSQMAVSLSAELYLRKIPGTHLCQGAEWTYR
jgi:hypothetical protein